MDNRPRVRTPKSQPATSPRGSINRNPIPASIPRERGSPGRAISRNQTPTRISSGQRSSPRGQGVSKSSPVRRSPGSRRGSRESPSQDAYLGRNAPSYSGSQSRLEGKECIGFRRRFRKILSDLGAIKTHLGRRHHEEDSGDASTRDYGEDDTKNSGETVTQDNEKNGRDVTPPSGLGTPVNAYGQLLVFETRLNDRAFYDTAPSWVRIPQGMEAEFLRRGLDIAQRTFHDTISTYMPEFANKNWLEGAFMVNFGFTDLRSQGFDDDAGLSSSKSLDLRNKLSTDAPFNVSHLRNRACHPGKNLFPQQLGEIDKLLMLAQGMACHLHHYRYAMEVRDLRDQLQNEGQNAYDDIMTRSQTQTKDTVWPLHHAKLFENAMRYKAEFTPVDDTKPRFPRQLLHIAKIWNQGGHDLSFGFPASGQIDLEDQAYVRVAGQDDGYFGREKASAWAADTQEFRDVILRFGAPVELAGRTASDMNAEVEVRTAEVAARKAANVAITAAGAAARGPPINETDAVGDNGAPLFVADPTGTGTTNDMNWDTPNWCGIKIRSILGCMFGTKDTSHAE